MNDYLVHWGILGMKWGVRRFQNPDGTLTEAGKIRRAKLLSDSNSAKDASSGLNTTKKGIDDVVSIRSKKRESAARSAARKNAKELTNEELAEINKRLTLEKNYVELTSKEIVGAPEKIDKILERTALFLGVASAAITVAGGLKALSASGLPDFAYPKTEKSSWLPDLDETIGLPLGLPGPVKGR